VTDLVVRNGLVVDGTGAAPRPADVAIDNGVIVEVGPNIGRGHREIDADGRLVTPGFVDLHTHYDGQATWDPILAPSVQHGVTTVLMGNCGVGFAPVEADRHDWLISMMEGVEDIPGTALAEGLQWGWRSYPEYLDSLDRMERTIDVGSQVPHAALRAFVMGDRGADPTQHPSKDELVTLARLVGEGLDAGAMGVSTSRTENHRTSAGDNLGTLRAGEDELMALAQVLRDRGRGVFQLLSDCVQTTDDAFAKRERDLIAAFARVSGRPVSFTVQQNLEAPDRWRELVTLAEDLTAAGYDVKGQVAPRPIGVMLGLQATSNPFAPCRAYQRIAHLPLAERAAAMADPALRQKIIASHAALTAGDGAFPGLAFLGRFDDMYLLDDPVDYDLDASRSLGAIARRTGADPRELVYDSLLAREGKQLIYMPLYNFANGNLDDIREMITSPVTMYGLSDAGAHCGTICDASTTTSYLTVWGRDRADRLPIEQVVHSITQRTAAHIGWLDRGVVAPGYLADLNVIDFDALNCSPPRIAADLPAGGRRLLQDAHGYGATIKRGQVTFLDGEHTGALPGSLLRGEQPAPALAS
jgi:N-acyl-D-aspartate/D-glutamate deacylase